LSITGNFVVAFQSAVPGSMEFAHNRVSVKAPAHFSGAMLAQDIASDGLLEIDGDPSRILAVNGNNGQNIVSIGKGLLCPVRTGCRVSE
jgi:hypothetical protein